MRGMLLPALLLLSAAALAQSPAVTPLISFPGPDASGTEPLTGVIQASDGFFYGTTHGATGSCDCGTVFSYSAVTGPATQYTFTSAAAPMGLIESPGGSIFGVTELGGSGDGSLFILNGDLTINSFYSFTGGADGSHPGGSLALGNDGNLWGVTEEGGSGYGTVFEVSPHNGALTTVYTFTGGADGGSPTGTLTQGQDGAFYGAALDGPDKTSGEIFRISTAGAMTVYSAFSTQSGGTYPNGNVAFASGGILLGTAGSGGPGGEGLVYQASATGTQQVVQSFDGDDNGGYPADGLFAASDGNFYGTTEGDSTFGNFFAVSPTTGFKTYYQFDNDVAGSTPTARAIQGNDGNFYGTTSSGGANGSGVFYQLTPPAALAAPVSLALSAPVVKVGASVTLTGIARNAAAVGSQQCYGYLQAHGELGQLTGSLSGTTWTGSLTVAAPSTAGNYTYAVTCAGQLSSYAPLAVTTTGTAVTTLTLSASPNPVYGGATVSFTAAAARSGTTGNPTGTVNFYYQGTLIGAATLKNGVATLTEASSQVPYGSYPIYAVYQGDSLDMGSTSNTVTVVSQARLPSTTALTITPTTVAAGGSATFTARVTGAAPVSGTVTFTTPGYTIATVNLVNGVATFTASSNGVPAGSYPIDAAYSGDAGLAGSTSAPVTVTVK